jgi:hypothetical protein
MSRTTDQRVTNLELTTEENLLRIKEYNAMISSKVGDATQFIDDDGKDHPHDWADVDDYDDVFDEEFRHVTNNPNVPESGPDFTPDVLDDTYLNMELALPQSGGEVEFARVVKRLLRDKDGLPIGTANDNSILLCQEIQFASH